MTNIGKIRLGAVGAALVTLSAIAWAQMPKPAPTPPMPAAEAAKRTAWDFKLTAIDGAPLPMSQFRGKVVMLVNTASLCGLAPQFEQLKTINSTYEPKGFTVVAVPSASFKQELGSNKAVSDHCRTTLGIKFPMAETADVVGPTAIPIYRWAAAKLPGQTPVWNFHKYLIGRDGKLIAAFPSRTVPNDPAVLAAIEQALKAPAKG